MEKIKQGNIIQYQDSFGKHYGIVEKDKGNKVHTFELKKSKGKWIKTFLNRDIPKSDIIEFSVDKNQFGKIIGESNKMKEKFTISYSNHPDAFSGGWIPGSKPEIKTEQKQFSSTDELKTYCEKQLKKFKMRYIEVLFKGQVAASYGLWKQGEWDINTRVNPLKENVSSLSLRKMLNESKWKIGSIVKYKSLKNGKWKTAKIISDLGKGAWELENGVIAYDDGDPDFKLIEK